MREIRTFLLLTAILSAPFYVWVSRPHLLMYAPAVAAVMTQLLHRRPLKELGFGFGKWRDYAVAYAVPIAFCIPVYLVTWSSGLGRFDTDALARLPLLPRGIPGAASAILLALIAAPLGMVNTFGEELGWTGLLTPRLLELTTYTRASIVRGLIWSVWHYPLVIALLPRYRRGLPIPYALFCMTVAVTAISFVYTWLRIDSGSVWPAALLHAVSSNLQDVCEALTRSTGPTYYITYEYGVGFAVTLSVIAIFFIWQMKRVSSRPSTP